MLINVPQYIDVEDKIVGPLTAKQLGWLIALGVSLLLMWSFLDRVSFFLIAIPLTFLFIALAFYRPYGQPLVSFLLGGVFYLFNPKIYVWKRTSQGIRNIPIRKKEDKSKKTIEHGRLTAEELENLSRTIDTNGAQTNEHILEMLRKAKLNNE